MRSERVIWGFGVGENAAIGWKKGTKRGDRLGVEKREQRMIVHKEETNKLG